MLCNLTPRFLNEQFSLNNILGKIASSFHWSKARRKFCCSNLGSFFLERIHANVGDLKSNVLHIKYKKKIADSMSMYIVYTHTHMRAHVHMHMHTAFAWCKYVTEHWSFHCRNLKGSIELLPPSQRHETHKCYSVKWILYCDSPVTQLTEMYF